jgi:hypothetical protein
MRSINESIEVACKPQRLFEALVSPTDICMWWSARSAIVLPRRNGFWAATWGKDENDPDYITFARLSTFDPPRTLVMSQFEYLAKGLAPLPFAGSLSTKFEIQDSGDSASLLSVTQSGFPDGPEADEFYRGCCQGWSTTLQSIRDYF